MEVTLAPARESRARAPVHQIFAPPARPLKFNGSPRAKSTGKISALFELILRHAAKNHP
jgi:hypothetical protein